MFSLSGCLLTHTVSLFFYLSFFMLFFCLPLLLKRLRPHSNLLVILMYMYSFSLLPIDLFLELLNNVGLYSVNLWHTIDWKALKKDSYEIASIIFALKFWDYASKVLRKTQAILSTFHPTETSHTKLLKSKPRSRRSRSRFQRSIFCPTTVE